MEVTESAKTLLEREIESCLGELSDIRLDEEKKSEAIDNVVKLYRLYNEGSKSEEELNLNRERFEFEKRKLEKDDAIRALENSERKKDRIIKIVLDSSSIILPLIFYGIWMRRGFEFEENGSYTSATFRNLFGQFKAKNK
jgi:hypothetical protein